ncbi:LysM peptidoglycan-binding domain-containing protein [Sporosarcina pasteurii]|uniref:Sporulation-specific glycosylase ydhD n=1 Tax=Sporosarcina pasteurii TaxID=1474 RepID=A0A380BQU0_SPOPA|nr:LysM peptidoglycan-binding domain-containing protein [Sporosarcina pasteurii]MDS9471199.1 LysM peptidoglycan-binding domain-containing protein [Sporosarcina pasteurii]QBQ05164.1 LysM peptidoglycan-binding domain-containing protein [Sporosarcina pasteurii]SUJ05549.1 Putative sporulation-specific glycosylase ydhD [Sporosarcina pasteurii]
MEIYVTQSGDTLSKIAQQFQVTVEQIVNANELEDPDALVVGMALVIPTPDQQHIVQPGESLWQIAARYNVPLQSIIQVNFIRNPTMISPGTRLTIPPRKPVIDVNAYTLNPGEVGANEIHEVGPDLTYCMPFTYSFNEDGTLNEMDDTAIIRAAYEERVVPVLCLTNFSATETGTELAHALLTNPDVQNQLLTNLLAVMNNKGYAGINIDFENIQPSDRENYNQFLQRTIDRFHPEGYFVSTAVAPKVSSEQRGLLYEAHDYEAHGRIVDFVILMTYEWGNRFGPPQAISPITQIKRVLDYAITVIPRDKIFFGFQIYARDWRIPHVEGQEAETFSQQEAIRRAIEFGTAIQYDKETQSPFFQYTDHEGQQHEVWFEDARSAQAKFDLVKAYNLRGISYWVLGYPFPQNWLLLEDNFMIRKRI